MFTFIIVMYTHCTNDLTSHEERDVQLVLRENKVNPYLCNRRNSSFFNRQKYLENTTSPKFQ